MTHPGTRPVAARVVASFAVLLALIGAWGLAGAGLGPLASGRAAAATSPTTTPWVPGVNGTLRIGIDRAPNGCNPDSASGDTWADRLVLGPVLPSAFAVNGNGKVIYDPAIINQAELQSTTPQTVVYTINPKAVWSNGVAVSAQDFIATWEVERGTTGPIGPAATSKTPGATSSSSTTTTVPPPAAASTLATSLATGSTVTLPGATGVAGPAFGYRQIDSITPSNHGQSFTVVFKRPYADWQSLFDEVLPARVLRRDGWHPTCTTVDPSVDLSAGPFVIRKVVPKHEIVLGRNKRWWEQTPALSRVVIKIASGPKQLATWLQGGSVDVALPAGFDQRFLQQVSSQPNLFSEEQPSTTFLELQFSTTSTVTAPLVMRDAIAHAIDRQAVVNKVEGWADTMIAPGASFLYAQTQSGYPGHPPPPQVRGQPGATSHTATHSSTSTPFPPTASLGATARLLARIGYAKNLSGEWQSAATGAQLTLRLAVDDTDLWARRAGDQITRQLAAAGFGVTVVPTHGAQAAGKDLSSGAADLALIPMHSSPYPSQAIAWYTPLLGSAGNNGSQDWSGLDNPTVNTLLEKAAEELNPVDASPIYTQVDALLWKNMVGLPIFTQPSALAWTGLTAGVSTNLIGPTLLQQAQTWSMRVPPTSPNAQP